MDNILLVFLNNLGNVEEFNEIIDKFAQKNYSMYLLDNIKEDEYFSMESLPELVEFYKSQHESVNKVVVLSNARDLMFSWYRCYNSLVDDFIYFIDEDDKSYYNPTHRHYTFYKYLSQFSGIEEENVCGKIYININFGNHEKIMKFLVQYNNFRYFNSLDRYNFNKDTTERINKSKKYIHNKYEYSFYVDNTKDVENIKLLEIDKKGLEINNELLRDILENIYIIPYMTVCLYRRKGHTVNNLLVTNYSKLKDVDKQQQKDIFEKLFIYINSNNINFKEKIYIASLLVMINNEDERLTEFMMKTLLNDQKYIEYHYGILINILFYQGNEGLRKHKTYEFDRKEVIERLSELNKSEIYSNNKVINKEINKIIIVTDQLLTLNHSPTKTTLDIAKSIKVEYPDVNIKIVVEDNLYCKGLEKIIPYLFTSIESKDCQLIHELELFESYIDVYYANNNMNLITKLSETVKEIDNFCPDVIFYTTPISLSVRSLLKFYPVVYISYNDFNFTIPSDIYLERSKSEVIKENEKYKLINNNNVYEFSPSRKNYIGAKSKYNREEFKLNSNDFVIVTVGNRLDGEITDEFIDMIADFMKCNDRIKWVIVGNCQLNYFKNKYKDIFLNNTIKIEYEYDLPALYGICDVYLNPQRSTGGGSIFTAMYEGLPIVMLSNYSDAINHIGIENTCGYDLNDIKNELYKLYNNSEYMNAKSILMKERVKFFETKKNKDTKELWMYFNKAVNNFRDRVRKEK